MALRIGDLRGCKRQEDARKVGQEEKSLRGCKRKMGQEKSGCEQDAIGMGL